MDMLLVTCIKMMYTVLYRTHWMYRILAEQSEWCIWLKWERTMLNTEKGVYMNWLIYIKYQISSAFLAENSPYKNLSKFIFKNIVWYVCTDLGNSEDKTGPMTGVITCH